MFGLAHRAVLLAPAEDAFDHRSTRLRHAIAFVPRGASVDGAPTTLAGCGDAVVLRHMRRNVDGAQMGHMVGRVIGLIFAHRDAAETAAAATSCARAFALATIIISHTRTNRARSSSIRGR